MSDEKVKNKKIFFTLQGKGGVSKTTISVWLHQYLLSTGATVQGFDTDPTNRTYAAFKGLNVKEIEIMENNQINTRGFDSLVDDIFDIEADYMIVDNGATSFNAIVGYLQENGIYEMLKSNNIEPIINTVLVGGSEHIDTLTRIKELHENTNEKMLVWMNYHFGTMPEGKYQPQPILQKFLGDRLLGLIEIPFRNSDTFGKDIQGIQALRATFDEFIKESPMGRLPTSRIGIFRDDLFTEIDKVLG